MRCTVQHFFVRSWYTVVSIFDHLAGIPTRFSTESISAERRIFRQKIKKQSLPRHWRAMLAWEPAPRVTAAAEAWPQRSLCDTSAALTVRRSRAGPRFMAAELCSQRSSYASASLAVPARSTKAPRHAQTRSVSRRRAAGWFSAGLTWLAATMARPRNAGADADAPDEEAEDATGALLASACGKDCLTKCFANFGAALVPGNRADVEVYCRSRCVFLCDVVDDVAPTLGQTGPSATTQRAADPLNALAGRQRSGKFCREGKRATAAVDQGVYAAQGLEFYGCK